MIPELEKYEDELKQLVCEEGLQRAKSNLLDVLKHVHDRDLLRKGGLVLDFLNGVKMKMRTLVLVFDLVCGSCSVSHAQVYRNPYVWGGYYSYPRRSTQQRQYKPYGYRRYAQPYVRPRPYTRPWWMR